MSDLTKNPALKMEVKICSDICLMIQKFTQPFKVFLRSIVLRYGLDIFVGVIFLGFDLIRILMVKLLHDE